MESARKAGVDEVGAVRPTGKWANLVKDGEACAEWAEKCRRGEVPPPPFKTHGRVGKEERFSLSAMREWLREQQTKGAEEGISCGAGERDRQWGGRGVESATSGEVRAAEGRKPRERQSAEEFSEKMRPEGFVETPRLVQLLKDGALDEAEDFWR